VYHEYANCRIKEEIMAEVMTARAIELSKERYCGAGAMLGKVAHLTHTYRIVEAAETPVVAAPLS
jgi:uncharacterized OsmC-like protein